jgi:ATP-dependent RNA helicase RhlE
MRFEDLRLSGPLLRAVRAAGYAKPTPIQSTAIPHVLNGRDVLGCAQTGTGKTAAFALPILQRLSEPAGRGRKPSSRIRALVLCPTRELAQQINDSFGDYARYTGLRQVVVFGGVNQKPQARAVRAGIDILIATPGRLLDLVGQGLVSLADVEILVLDEADRMLDMGFLPDVRRILGHLPRQRQTLLFSATMPSGIRTLANQILRDPVPVQVARVSSPVPTVGHWVQHVERPQKPMLLLRLLQSIPFTRALIFTRTKHGADKVARHLVRAGVPAAALHGNKSQGARTRTLAEFRSAQTPVLVATDIAARGLDVEDISHVINYDLTRDPETYVHRIGRTGRAGATGTAVSFCTEEEHGALRAIERLLLAPLQRNIDIGGCGEATPPQPVYATVAPVGSSHRRRRRPAGSRRGRSRPGLSSPGSMTPRRGTVQRADR